MPSLGAGPAFRDQSSRAQHQFVLASAQILPLFFLIVSCHDAIVHPVLS